MKQHITYNDEELYVEYDYYPYERPVMYYPDGSGYPGSPAEAHVTLIEKDGVDISDSLSEKQWEEIEEILLNNHYDDE